METGKQKIADNLLFALSLPLVAFDVFLFYDDGVGDLELIGKLWLITFLSMLILGLYRGKITAESNMAFQLIGLAYSSCVVLFFTMNLFLVGMFAMMIYTRNEFIV